MRWEEIAPDGGAAYRRDIADWAEIDEPEIEESTGQPQRNGIFWSTRYSVKPAVRGHR
jgi:hypothetical protein